MYLGVIKWRKNPIYQRIIITCFRKTDPREVNNSTVDLHKDSSFGFPCWIAKIIWTATFDKVDEYLTFPATRRKKWKSYGYWNFWTEVKGNPNGKKEFKHKCWKRIWALKTNGGNMTENAGLKQRFKERKCGMLGCNVSHFSFYKDTHV